MKILPIIDGDKLHPATRKRSPLTYFVLTFALSSPFWIAGALSNFQLLPALPVSAFGVLCMVGAAAILAYHENGRAGVVALLKRSFDFKRVRAKIWYVPTILLMPCIMVLSYVLMRRMGRVIITWLYNNMGRSVFVAVLFHAMINVTWQLFPINGSYYDPRVTGLISTAVVVVLVIGWGPRTLVRTRNAQKSGMQEAVSPVTSA